MNIEENIGRAIEELGRAKRISKEELIMALETALLSAYRKNFGPAMNVHVEVTDGIRVYATKEVIENPLDPRSQMSLADAQAVDSNLKVGDTLKVEITPSQFGRIAAQTAKQVIIQKIREAERRLTAEEFEKRKYELIVGQVQRFEKGDIYLDYNGVEVLLPLKEQIPGQRFRQQDRIKAVIVEVSRSSRGPQVIVSRADREFLRRLFEKEIPEIQEALVVIKGIAREPGIRSKVAVHSVDPNIDPVGACVGLRGSRIQSIVQEIGLEKIDIVPFSEDIRSFVAAALSPARPVRMVFIAEESRIQVVVPEYQLSLAIGKEGQNVRLAAKLTQVRIDIAPVSEAGDLASSAGADPNGGV
ncbi:MAG: transcription termination/antitermination protein NusA [Candidatus Riflebacteria bacterium]|nr:transcription termination/antitermination protein NusA [Candidatus Riflebacteria bacterium]